MTATPIPTTWPLPGHDGVLLRPPTREDVEALVAAGNDDDVQRFTRLPHPFTAADALLMVTAAERAHAQGTGLHLLAVDGPTLLVQVTVAVDPRDHTAEVGYWSAPAGRGRGVVTAAVREAVGHVITACGVQMLHLVAATANPGSGRVAERVGFQRAGLLRRRANIGITGDPAAERSDMVVYDLLPEELT